MFTNADIYIFKSNFVTVLIHVIIMIHSTVPSNLKGFIIKGK